MRITVLLSFLVVYGRTSYGQVSQTYNDYYLSYSHNSPDFIVSHSIRRENVYRFTTDGHKITDSTLAVSNYYDDKGRIAEADIFNSKGNVTEITEFEYAETHSFKVLKKTDGYLHSNDYYFADNEDELIFNQDNTLFENRITVKQKVRVWVTSESLVRHYYFTQ